MLEPDRRDAMPGVDEESTMSMEQLLEDLTAAASLPPEAIGKIDQNDLIRHISIENLTDILSLAEGYPAGWLKLRAYLKYMAETYAKVLADVDWKMDAGESHAQRCFFGGAAKALAWMAGWLLDPERIRRQIESLRKTGRPIGVETQYVRPQ